MKKMKHRNAEVLFQKLGDTWFVFSELQGSGDVIYSSLPAGMNPHDTKLELYELIAEHLEKINQLNQQRAAKKKSKIGPQTAA